MPEQHPLYRKAGDEADTPRLTEPLRIAVVIPCFRVRDKILDVLAQIGPEVYSIYCIDDCCPEGTGYMVQQAVQDPRVQVIFHKQNQGVGGATLSGYRAALTDGATVIVKIDGDGQMDPRLIQPLIRPILRGQADYAKGNRFFHLEHVQTMPRIRLFGNAVLSFMSKFSGGYWQIFDPTNGYTAIHAKIAAALPFNKVSQRYFFESDMLYHLYNERAVVADVPMPAQYGSEVSNLRTLDIITPFLLKHASNFAKRVFYNYFLRDFSIASVELSLGLIALVFGVLFGTTAWINSLRTGVTASAGTVMLAALPIIVGVQLLLGFLNFDMQNAPRRVLHPVLE